MHSQVRGCCRTPAEKWGRVGGPGALGARQRHPGIKAPLGHPLVYRLKIEHCPPFPMNGGGEQGDWLSHITGTAWVPLDGKVAEGANRRTHARHLSILENANNAKKT